LGQPLQSFKHFTKTFDPIARGHAIDSFDFVRKIHNSFAKSTDMLAIDSLMKEKNMKNAKRLQTQAASAAKTAKAEAKKAAEAAAEQSTTSTVRSNPRRRARNTKSVAEQDNQDEQEQESGFHFIAYMPIEDSVWKLDGLDSFPTNIGRMTPGQDWLSLIQTTLSVRMAEYEEGQIQFSLMAVVQDPIIQARRALAQNLRSIQAIEARLDELTPDWPSFVAADSEDSVVCCPQEVSSLTDAMIAEAPLTPKTAQHLTCTCSETLIRVRTELKKDQTGCLAEIRDSQQTDMLEELESMHRRHDYGSFVKAWMHALVSNGALKSLLDDEQS
jgi:ubiquitin carboxyl-terminal hydrolase L5